MEEKGMIYNGRPDDVFMEVRSTYTAPLYIHQELTLSWFGLINIVDSDIAFAVVPRSFHVDE